MRIVFRRWWHGASRLADCSLPEQGPRMGRIEPPARPWRAGRTWPADAAPLAEAVTSVPAPSRSLSRAFTATLLGAGPLHGGEPAPSETRFLEQLERAARAEDTGIQVPRLPSVLPRLLRLLGREDAASREIADLLRREPALLGRVMRIVNSARYRGEAPIESLEAAIALLGHRGIHEVVSQAVMAPVFSPGRGRFGLAAGRLLWDQAERCAHACAFLHTGTVNAFGAYLAGMSANVGLIVSLRLLDRHPLPAIPASVAFHDALGRHATRLSAGIARHWGFPDEIPQAVEALASDVEPVDPADLAQPLGRADRASKAHVLAASGLPGWGAGGSADEACRLELDRVFGPARSEAGESVVTDVSVARCDG